MTTYTKGPYVAWDDGRTIGIEGQDGEPLAIAEIVDHGDMTSEAQMLADQGLFAEAFNMAEALRDLIAWAERTGIADDEPPVYVNACAILARINGEAVQDVPAAPDNSCGQCEGTGTTQSASNLESEECPVCDGMGTLPEAVGDVEGAAALVRDALELLDAVGHIDDGALEEGRLIVMPHEGPVFRVNVTLAGDF